MEHNEAYVGARVECTKPFAGLGSLVGKFGTIVKVFSRGHTWDVAVEFDEAFPDGHNCDRDCKNGHGRFGEVSSLELIQETTPELTMTFEEAMGWTTAS